MPTLRCFDLDGCVVVSDEAIADALLHAVHLVGLPVPGGPRIRAAVGPPLLTTFAALVRESGHDPEGPEGTVLLTEAVAAYRARYEEVGFDLTRPVDGIVALLTRIRSVASATTVIVTAKPTAVAEPLLRHVGLLDAFDAVYGAPMGPEVEEKRVTLRRALDETGMDPERAVMIGDRSHDVHAGRACGTRTVGVLWGAGDRDELELAGADLVVARPDELEEVLLSSGSSAGR